MRRAALWAGIAAAASIVAVLAWVRVSAEPALEATLRSPKTNPTIVPETPPIAPVAERDLPVESLDESASAAGDQDVEASRPTTALGDSGSIGARPTPAPSAHVAGEARDELGLVLAAHVVEVISQENVLEGSGVTDAEGRFRIDGLSPGLKELRLLGPGAGDVWRSVWGSVDVRLDHHIELAVEERRLSLAVPESGIDDLVLKSTGHRDVLVTARLVDDLNRPIGSCSFQFGRDPEGYSPAGSEADGMLTGLVTVLEDSRVELSVDDDSMEHMRALIAEYEARDPEPPSRYLPIEVQLRTAPMQQDLGTLVMPRMAGLALTLVDSTSLGRIEAATVRLRCTGGGLPSSEESLEIDAQGAYLWSGRTAGEYELDVTATGYQAAHQVGVLVVSDEPQTVELILERTR